MPKIATRLFQFLLLFQTIIWILAKVGVDQTLKSGVEDFHFYWVLLYAVIISLAIFDKYLALFSWLVQTVSGRINSRKLIKIIQDLKPQEKQILGQFVVDRKREVFLSSLDENTEWLASNKIIIRTGSTAGKKDGYKLAIWARDYLIKNPNFLY